VQGFRAPETIVTQKTTSPPPAPPALDFEKALEELEATVEKLEHGDLSLEDALQQFERGVALARVCQASLKQAEQKVEILLQRSTDAAPEPFEPGDE
jgi:exodeoxyribonuclease VII small subunit